jgi:hypothetical protein
MKKGNESQAKLHTQRLANLFFFDLRFIRAGLWLTSLPSSMVDLKRARRLASVWASIKSSSLICQDSTGALLELSDEAKQIVQDLGTAINEAVESSSSVAETIERLREAGYEMELTLRLEIGLRPHEPEEARDDASLNLTDEDRRTLRRMKIRIDKE